MQNVRGKRVFVGLSGGVDSAASAALLKNAGARVTGVFIKGWYPPGMPCTWAQDRRDAMRVAARLGIPFQTLDASEEYKKGVIDYLVREYRAGRTPNPDVMCNREVKFGAFFTYAMAHGADWIATGHYRAGEKDQSYFLWAVPKEALARTIFPVGNMEKETVRRLARKFDLPVAAKKDSQGICFLGAISVDEFLQAQFGSAPGPARDASGAPLGMHDGALLHTLGERVSLRGAPPGPWYVLAKDISANTLIVGKEPRMPGTGPERIGFTDQNWLADPSRVRAAVCRYRGKPVAGSVENGSIFVAETPFAEAPAPGQSIVFFNESELVGGGIIAA